MRLPNALRWLRTRNAAIAFRRAADATRVKGVVGKTPDLEPLSAADRALLPVIGQIRPGNRIAIASGRIVTGWELVQLAPDLLTLEILDDHDRFVAEELARDPVFRRAYTALGKPGRPRYQHECGDAEYCSCLTPSGNPTTGSGEVPEVDAA